MTRRVIHWIGNVLRDEDHETEVHFHSGPGSAPAACHNERCEAPRLAVGSG